MKRKLIIAFITISFVFASWNFINPSFDNSNKDKLLIEIVKYVLEKYHYNSIEINDEFSEKMFDAYIELLDSQKINSLGWESSTSLASGLELTYDWFKKNNSIF